MVTMSTVSEPTTGAWPPKVHGEWTVADLLDTPDDGQRYEVIDGTLLVTPAPTPRHQSALFELAVLLRSACPPNYKVFVAPLDWQPDTLTSLQPDILVIRKDQIGEKNISAAPTLVVEVASPRTARIDRTVKLSRYADGGIARYWIVDPRVPSVQVFDLVEGRYRVSGEASADAPLTISAPFPVTVVPQALIA